MGDSTVANFIGSIVDRFSGVSKALEAYLGDYFAQLKTELALIPEPADAGEKKLRTDAMQLAETPLEEQSWRIAYMIDAAIVRLLPEKELRAKACSLKAEFREVLGEARAAELEKCLLTDDKDVAQLRAALQQMLREIQWFYSSVPAQEAARGSVMRWTIAISVVFIIVPSVFAIWITFYEKDLNIGPLPIAFCCGGIGGLISTLRRIQRFQLTQGNVVVNLLDLSRGAASVYLAPFLGGVFAVLLCILFVAGLVEGGLFPRMVALNQLTPPIADAASQPVTLQQFLAITNDVSFAAARLRDAADRLSPATQPANADKGQDTPDVRAAHDQLRTGAEDLNQLAGQIQKRAAATSLYASTQPSAPIPPPQRRGDNILGRFVRDLRPASYLDLAKLAFWAFIAGFAEAFVPDKLDRLTAAGAAAGGSAPPTDPKKPKE